MDNEKSRMNDVAYAEARDALSDDRPSSQIFAEIARTRLRVEQLINQLSDQVHPRRFLHEAVNFIQETWRDESKRQQVWDDVRSQLKSGGWSVSEYVSKHPAALLLIGIGGLLLMADETKAQKAVIAKGKKIRDRAQEQGSHLMQRLRKQAHDLQDAVKHRSEDMREKVKHKVEDVRSKTSEHDLKQIRDVSLSKVKDSASTLADKVKDSTSTLAERGEKNPAMTGLVVLGLGLAAGMAIPTPTRKGEAA